MSTTKSIPAPAPPGLCQWFHYEDVHELRSTIEDLAELGIQRLRTGISWADYHRPRGRDWYDFQMSALADAGIEVLLSIWHTPPSISMDGHCSAPPRRLADYADFLEEIILRYGGTFEALELWNEPNNRLKWNFLRHDPDWSKFSEMVMLAAERAKRLGQLTVLGGMIPVDPYWLAGLRERGALEHVDVIAIHGFPGMWTGDSYWWDWPQHWRGWAEKIASIRSAAEGRPVWITETGFATCAGNSPRPEGEGEQVRRLEAALRAPAERVFWYSVRDLRPDYPCIEMTEDGGRIDYREYHLGLSTWDGARKPGWHRLRGLVRKTPTRASARTPVEASSATRDAFR